MIAYCERCGDVSAVALSEFALGMPEGKTFWRAHPRLRLLGERLIEADGHPAIVVGHESVTDHARYEVVFTHDTFLPLEVRVGR
jgi:hypothetical protein